MEVCLVSKNIYIEMSIKIINYTDYNGNNLKYGYEKLQLPFTTNNT